MKASLKQKLKKNQLTIGSWITMTDTCIAEIMAKAGFDWLAVDMEHSALTVQHAMKLIQTIDLCGIPALVRVGDNNPTLIKRVMDAGATGVIVPMVNTAQEAQKAVNAVKYPPEGTRGIGLSRAQGYGTTFNEYKRWVKNESVVIVQIEHIEAVENLDKIFAVQGIDGFLVGLYDLSGSMGIAGEFENPKLIAALKRIMLKAKEKGVTAGIHCVPTDTRMVKDKIKKGFRFIAYSVDFLLLGDQCREGLKLIKK